MEGLKIHQGHAAILLVVTAFGISACGGSSSGGDRTPSGPSLTETQQRQLLAESTIDFARDASSSEALFVAGDFGGVDSISFVDPRDGIQAFTFGPQVRSQQMDEFELCNAGGSFTEEINQPDHVRLVWSNCRTLFSEPDLGISFDSLANGVVEAKWSEPSPAGYAYLIETKTESFSIELDSTIEGDSIFVRFAADGATIVEWTSDLDFMTEANSDTEFDLTCNGQSFGGKIGFEDVFVKVEPTGVPNEGALTFGGTYRIGNFSPDLDGAYTYATLETVFFDQFNPDRPYQGVVQVTGNGFDVTVRFEPSGLFIDDEFYTWEQFEADLDEVDIDFDGDACF